MPKKIQMPEWAHTFDGAEPFTNADSVRKELQVDFMSETAKGYFQQLVQELWNKLSSEDQQCLAYVLNQGKWSVGWKEAGRILLEEMS